MSRANEITSLLSRLHDGQASAAHGLMPLVYQHLRRMAASRFSHERKGHTLSPTDLVHDLYFRLIKPGTGPWKNRHHFFRVAARAMRQILVDYARRHAADKRGKGWTRIDLEDAVVPVTGEMQNLLGLDKALHGLAKLSKRQSTIVELRFFGGLTVKETAAVLHISATTVKDEWASARAWLLREIERSC
jgi:RNA polymerase sigma factor (TIGR02999 family)